MTVKPPDPAAAIRFAENALHLLEQGGFVATYKYAVLLGLRNLCLEGTSRDGVPPSECKRAYATCRATAASNATLTFEAQPRSTTSSRGPFTQLGRLPA